MTLPPNPLRVAFYPPVHPEYARALRVLDAFDMPYAEAWRMLRPVAVRLGIPRPSYSTVRRLAIAERERKRRHADELDLLLTDLFKGRFPLVWVEHKLIGVRTLPARPGKSARARPPPRGGGRYVRP